MKKNLLIVFMFSIALVGFGQRITKNVTDDFTGGKVIYTSWETLSLGNIITGTNHLFFRFRYENNMVYFHLKWITGDVTSIDKGAKLIFKFNNDSLSTLYSLAYTLSGSTRIGGIINRSIPDNQIIDGIYIGDDMRKFMTNDYPVKMRIYTTSGYVDMKLDKSDAEKIKKAYLLLYVAMSK